MDMTVEMAVALLASGLTTVVVHPLKKVLPSTQAHGSLKNALLPVCAVLVGLVLALIKAWFLRMEIRSEEGFELLLWGVMIGLASIGLRGAAKPFKRLMGGDDA